MITPYYWRGVLCCTRIFLGARHNIMFRGMFSRPGFHSAAAPTCACLPNAGDLSSLACIRVANMCIGKQNIAIMPITPPVKMCVSTPLSDPSTCKACAKDGMDSVIIAVQTNAIRANAVLLFFSGLKKGAVSNKIVPKFADVITPDKMRMFRSHVDGRAWSAARCGSNKYNLVTVS